MKKKVISWILSTLLVFSFSATPGLVWAQRQSIPQSGPQQTQTSFEERLETYIENFRQYYGYQDPNPQMIEALLSLPVKKEENTELSDGQSDFARMVVPRSLHREAVLLVRSLHGSSDLESLIAKLKPLMRAYYAHIDQELDPIRIAAIDHLLKVTEDEAFGEDYKRDRAALDTYWEHMKDGLFAGAIITAVGWSFGKRLSKGLTNWVKHSAMRLRARRATGAARSSEAQAPKGAGQTTQPKYPPPAIIRGQQVRNHDIVDVRRYRGKSRRREFLKSFTSGFSFNISNFSLKQAARNFVVFSGSSAAIGGAIGALKYHLYKAGYKSDFWDGYDGATPVELLEGSHYGLAALYLECSARELLTDLKTREFSESHQDAILEKTSELNDYAALSNILFKASGEHQAPQSLPKDVEIVPSTGVVKYDGGHFECPHLKDFDGESVEVNLAAARAALVDAKNILFKNDARLATLTFYDNSIRKGLYAEYANHLFYKRREQEEAAEKKRLESTRSGSDVHEGAISKEPGPYKKLSSAYLWNVENQQYGEIIGKIVQLKERQQRELVKPVDFPNTDLADQMLYERPGALQDYLQSAVPNELLEKVDTVAAKLVQTLPTMRSNQLNLMLVSDFFDSEFYTFRPIILALMSSISNKLEVTDTPQEKSGLVSEKQSPSVKMVDPAGLLMSLLYGRSILHAPAFELPENNEEQRVLLERASGDIINRFQTANSPLRQLWAQSDVAKAIYRSIYETATGLNEGRDLFVDILPALQSQARDEVVAEGDLEKARRVIQTSILPALRETRINPFHYLGMIRHLVTFQQVCETRKHLNLLSVIYEINQNVTIQDSNKAFEAFEKFADVEVAAFLKETNNRLNQLLDISLATVDLSDTIRPGGEIIQTGIGFACEVQDLRDPNYEAVADSYEVLHSMIADDLQYIQDRFNQLRPQPVQSVGKGRKNLDIPPMPKEEQY